MNSPIKSSLPLLAIAGLVSTAFTLTEFVRGDFGQYSVGCAFGLALAIYFVLREGVRNPAKIVAFLAACTAAYAASMSSGFELVGIFPANGDMGSGRWDIPMPAFFGAGCVGAFIVLAAGVFLFGPHDIGWNSIGRVLLWSLGGGVLGVLGGGADGLRTQGTFNKFLLLFLVWQPGAAALLGWLLNHERKLLTAPSQVIAVSAEPPPARASRGVLAVAWIFFACVFAFLGFLALHTIQARRMAAVQDAAYARFRAEAPSTADLPQLETLPVEQALIVSQIAGLYPWAPMTSPVAPQPPIQPRAISYSIGYTAIPDPPPISVRRIIAVEIEQLPNANWALYKVKYPPSNVAVYSPKALSRVTKFGQTVVQNTVMRYPNGGGTLSFLWPSGRFVVTVYFETPDVSEEFLRQYLGKYPSSLWK
jgi:hypothetical protein